MIESREVKQVNDFRVPSAGGRRRRRSVSCDTRQAMRQARGRANTTTVYVRATPDHDCLVDDFFVIEPFIVQ